MAATVGSSTTLAASTQRSDVARKSRSATGNRGGRPVSRSTSPSDGIRTWSGPRRAASCRKRTSADVRSSRLAWTTTAGTCPASSSPGPALTRRTRTRNEPGTASSDATMM